MRILIVNMKSLFSIIHIRILITSRTLSWSLSPDTYPLLLAGTTRLWDFILDYIEISYQPCRTSSEGEVWVSGGDRNSWSLNKIWKQRFHSHIHCEISIYILYFSDNEFLSRTIIKIIRAHYPHSCFQAVNQ